MAIIGKIRERSTLVLVIIGLAIVAFVLTDLFSAKAGGQQGPINLAEINGKVISAQDFDIRVQQGYENYMSNSQTNEPLDERTKSNVREQIWNEVVSDELLGSAMDKLGVKVTPSELFDMVQGRDPNPQVRQAFTNRETGVFDPNAVIQFIQNLDNNPEAKKQWVAFEKAIKRNQRIEKYNNLIKKGMYLPSPLATMIAKEGETKFTFSYVMKPYTATPDSLVEVSESEIKDYYNENKKDFEQKANRKAFYAYFPVRPSAIDVEQTRQWAFETYEKFKNAENDSTFVNANSDQAFDPNFYSVENIPMGADSTLWNEEIGFIKAPYPIEMTFYIHKVRASKMAPDSVKARHILINTADRTPEEAEALADSIKSAIEGGSDFAELAKELSDDVGSGQNGGDLNWFTEGMMVKPFNDAAFSAEIGKLQKVKSQFGYHIIEVTEQTAMKKKIQIATIMRTTEPSQTTYEEVFNNANSFSINATDLESFNKLVNEQNIQRRVAVIGENDNLIQGEPESRDLVRWIKAANENEVSDAEDFGDAFAVAVVEEINEDGPAPLEKVRNTVEYLAKQKKKGELFSEEMKSYTDLESLASGLGLQVQNATNLSFTSPSIPNMGSEPAVLGKLYTLQKGALSVPIAGNIGVFVLKVDDRVEVANPDLFQVRSSYARSSQSQVDNGLVFTALKKQADIEDNRSKFY